LPFDRAGADPTRLKPAAAAGPPADIDGPGLVAIGSAARGMIAEVTVEVLPKEDTVEVEVEAPEEAEVEEVVEAEVQALEEAAIETLQEAELLPAVISLWETGCESSWPGSGSEPEGSRSETWKTGWTFVVGGRSSLQAW
jgi:hypothetical protein